LNCPDCEKPLVDGELICRSCGNSIAGRTPGDESEGGDISSLRAGEVIDGKWEMGELIGRGGMAAVYRGHDVALDRDVAIKVLARRYCINAELVERFEREAKRTAQLEHPNIVPVHAVGRHQGRPYMVMSLIEGETLSSHIRISGALPPEEVLRLMRQFCAGIAFIHAKNLVHRDIKPSNLFLGRDGRAWILDLGVVRDPRTSGLTQTGMLIGTPQYMSPEQARGVKGVDHRADLYALGLVLFEMLTAKRAVGSAKGLQAAEIHIKGPPPDPADTAPWVPRAVADVVCKVLAKDPNERFQSANELMEGLETAYQTSLIDRTAIKPVEVADEVIVTQPYRRAVKRRRKILVVDDSDVALEAARISLEESGFDVVTLENPLVLVTKVRAESPDLVLLDISMPALAGDELVGIVGRHQDMAHTPVVLHSDLPKETLAERARNCGAAGYIQKTADPDEFVKQVRRWLGI
jgi:serine/threonine protein kinase